MDGDDDKSWRMEAGDEHVAPGVMIPTVACNLYIHLGCIYLHERGEIFRLHSTHQFDSSRLI